MLLSPRQPEINPALLNPDQQRRLLPAIKELQRRDLRRKLYTYYPDTGPLRRELYIKHMEFFSAGALYRERLALAANRVGKSEGIGGYETALHLTGLYPEWWNGRRFKKAISSWAAGKTNTTTRDIIQAKLFGQVVTDEVTGKKSFSGTGLIPGDCIGKVTWKSGFQDLADSIKVKHVSGGWSTIGLKSYEQGRGSFEGTEQAVIWLDEEPPLEVYTECLVRTMTTNGLIILTFTPLEGLSDVVLSFLPDGKYTEGMNDNEQSCKYVVMATWDDAPHITDKQKKELWASIPPYQRDARSKGIPQLGSGAIYPVSDEDIVIGDFAIPDHWPRAYGLDVGWNKTAVIWAAWDLETDIEYWYAEYYRGQAEPEVHAAAIKAKGDWIEGAIDPAANGRSQRDGEQLINLYREHGLIVSNAINAVEAGIHAVFTRMTTGRLKIFKSLTNTIQERRLYRRDEHGKVVKSNDHAMDAGRYVNMSGQLIAQTKPVPKTTRQSQSIGGNQGWMR